MDNNELVIKVYHNYPKKIFDGKAIAIIVLAGLLYETCKDLTKVEKELKELKGKQEGK